MQRPQTRINAGKAKDRRFRIAGLSLVGVVRLELTASWSRTYQHDKVYVYKIGFNMEKFQRSCGFLKHSAILLSSSAKNSVCLCLPIRFLPMDALRLHFISEGCSVPHSACWLHSPYARSKLSYTPPM